MIVIWVIILLSSVLIYWTWILIGLLCALTRILQKTPPRWATALMSEIKPLYWPAAFVLLYVNMDVDDVIWRKALNIGAIVAAWYMFKNEGDNDRWKKRLSELKSKVSVKNGRLVVTSV